MKAALRPMDDKDLGMTYVWRNDELVRKFATAHTAISWAEHEALFKHAPAYKYIFEINDIPCRFISFSGQDSSPETSTTWSFHLAPEARGKGYADIMLGLAVLEAKRLNFSRIISEVKLDNEASLYLHMKFKFLPLKENPETGFLSLERDI